MKIPLFSPITQKILTVTLDGAVKKPGKYSFFEGATLHQIIVRLGDTLTDAYPYGASLYRKKVAEIQQEAFDKTYASLINFLASNGGVRTASVSSTLPTYHLSSLSSKQLSLRGGVSAEFSQRKVQKDPSLDTILV